MSQIDVSLNRNAELRGLVPIFDIYCVSREAELVEDEHPDREEEKEEEELQTIGDEGESPMSSYEDGSGGLEGSADLYAYAADQVIVPAEGDTGSGGTGVDYNGNFSCQISSLIIISTVCHLLFPAPCSVIQPCFFRLQVKAFTAGLWLMRQNQKRRS